MRIVCISDTHNQQRKEWFPQIPDGDVLVHAGDATIAGTIPEIVGFNAWLGTLPHKHKIFVAGNHDWLFQTDPSLADGLLTNAIYLQDSGVTINNAKFYGSPWQPAFQDWAFNLPRGEKLRLKWDLIPNETDVLITHGPPEGIRDWTFQGEHVGCRDLWQNIQGRLALRAHIFGHIHHAYGYSPINGTQFVNASICDEAYRGIREPIVIEI